MLHELKILFEASSDQVKKTFGVEQSIDGQIIDAFMDIEKLKKDNSPSDVASILVNFLSEKKWDLFIIPDNLSGIVTNSMSKEDKQSLANRFAVTSCYGMSSAIDFARIHLRDHLSYMADKDNNKDILKHMRDNVYDLQDAPNEIAKTIAKCKAVRNFTI